MTQIIVDFIRAHPIVSLWTIFYFVPAITLFGLLALIGEIRRRRDLY